MKIPHPMLKLQIEMTHTHPSQKEEETGYKPGKLQRAETGPKEKAEKEKEGGSEMTPSSIWDIFALGKC